MTAPCCEHFFLKHDEERVYLKKLFGHVTLIKVGFWSQVKFRHVEKFEMKRKAYIMKELFKEIHGGLGHSRMLFIQTSRRLEFAIHTMRMHA